MGTENMVYLGDPSAACGTDTDSCSSWGTNANWIYEPYYPQSPYIGDPLPPNDVTAPWTPPYTITYPYVETPKRDVKEELEELLKKHLKKEKRKEKNLMKVFEVTVIDRRECEILHEQKVIAKDTETAMIELDLTPEIKKKSRKNLVEFIFNEIGSFTKAERKVRVKDLEDED